MPPAPPATKASPSPAALARVVGALALLVVAAIPLASALAGAEAGGLVQAWRILRDAISAALRLQIYAPVLVDAGCAVFAAAGAAACEGAGRGGVSMMRGLAQGWRTVNRVSPPRSGPARPVTGFGQAPLANAYFLASVLLGALIVSQLVALLCALTASVFYADFNQGDYLVLSGGLWLVATLFGLRWSLVSWLGGLVLFPAYALLALALRGWRVALAAGLAALAAAAFVVFAA